MNNISVRFFRRLKEDKINYAVLRNYRTLPDSLGGSDLDMWVAKDDAARCKLILSEVAKDTNSDLVSYIDDRNSPKLCYLNNRDGIQIDLFIGSIFCKDQEMFNEESIVRNIKDYNGVNVLDDRFADIMAFLKEILNNGKCSEKYLTPLIKYKEVYTKMYLKKELPLFSSSFCDLLSNTIETGNFSSEFINLSIKGKECLGIKREYFRFSTLRKLSRLLKPTGYTLSFLGTDGSGKSFIINSITPILEEAFHKGVVYNHMRPNYLPSLAVATGRKSADEPVVVVTDPHASKPSGLIGSIARLSYYWIDYTWGYFRKVFPDKSIKSHVWLFDRYYYDFYVDQRRARLNLPSWIVKFYGFFVPSPDLTICLGGDPEKIYARKPETSLEEVTRQTNVLKEFARTHKNTVWIDTTVAPEETIKATMDAIVNMMSKRFANENINK